MGFELVGRESELTSLRQFLEGAGPGPSALVLEGAAGIGKTSLWRHIVATAREQGRLVLTAGPSGAEAQLSFAGLRDLLDEAFDEVGDALPGPQHDALAAALLRQDAERSAPEQGAIAAAALGVVRELSKRQPLGLAIDDIQWLDAPSVTVLEYAIRRLTEEPVVLLVARRLDGDRPLPLGLSRSLPEDRITRLRVGPLGPGALDRVLATGVGFSVSRRLLRRVHEESGGNPFFALEIARALQRGGQVEALEPLPMTPDLLELVRARLGRLGPETREVLAIAAACSRPTLGLVAAVVGDDPWPRLIPAVEAQVIEMDEERIRFTHPLLASAVMAEAGGRRREVHRRLADVVPDPEERARHLALGTLVPNEEAAAALDEAARIARRRGAPETAADLEDHALRLTPPGDGREAQRTMDAADAHSDAGNPERSLTLLRNLVGRLPRGHTRAQVLWRLGTVMGEIDSAASSFDPYQQALAECGGDDALRASIHANLAWMMCFVGTPSRGTEHAAMAVEAANAAGRDDLVSEAHAAVVFVDLMRGVEPPADVLRRAVELEPTGDRIRIDRCASLVQGVYLLWSGRFESARPVFERLRVRTADYGDESNAPVPLWNLALIDLATGDWARAAAYLEEARQTAELTGMNLHETLAVSAVLDAHLGNVERVRSTVEQTLGTAERFDEPGGMIRSLSTVGFLELSLDRPAEAHRHLERAGSIAASTGVREPWFQRFLVDDAEALAASGEPGEAERSLRRFEAAADGLDREWPRALADRGRGMILVSAGTPAEGIADLDRSREAFESAGMPFELGRTLLCLGVAQRRAKRWGGARASLERAAAAFDRLGARLWAERARAELARVGGRAPSRHDLTPTERRVAELVATGRTNKETAAALFLSVKTVEASLTRTYAKLGVRSRTELARRILDADEAR